ncbi:Uma2 family endonuclease [Phormidesmis sp. 146-12]
MTQAIKPPFTLEEYLDYDDGSDQRYELVDGELIELPNEDPHNLLIARFLLVYFIQMGLAIERVGDKQQITVVSSEATVRDPDLMVHSEASAAAILTQKQALLDLNMPNPLLVIEVVSPGNPGSKNYDRDYVHKPKEYAARGIPELWQVDPGRGVVVVLSLQNGAYRSSEFRGGDGVISPTFPDFQLTAEQILKGGR